MSGLPADLMRSLVRFTALGASAVLLAGCGAAGEDPVGPQADANPAVAVDIAPAAVRDRTELYEFGDFALYVPARVGRVRGILVTLGGPNTKAFAAGTPFGTPLPELEASLQTLGAMFRDLAAERGLAILGTSRFGPTALPNESASDQILLDAVAQGAALSGRPDLLDAPLLLYGISGGGPEAAGFAARHAGRVAALFLKVPAGVGAPTAGEALGVPTFVVLAELDAFIDNSAVASAFLAHRAAEAPWALALEPGVPHHSLSPAQRELTVGWLRTILTYSVDPASGSSLRRRPGAVGWLGDPATGHVAPAAAYAGDPGAASWLPTRALAEEWAAFIGY